MSNFLMQIKQPPRPGQARAIGSIFKRTICAFLVNARGSQAYGHNITQGGHQQHIDCSCAVHSLLENDTVLRCPRRLRQP